LDAQIREVLLDPRKEDETTHSLTQMFYLGMLLFLGALYSCRAMDDETRDEDFINGFRRLSGEHCDGITTTGNMTRSVWRRMADSCLMELCAWMTKQLILSKALDRFRLKGLFMVAVDGTLLFESRHRHCPYCLEFKHSDGSVSYRHYVLVAKLVTPIGLTLPMAVEFIENGDFDMSLASDEVRKQDCEMKAFKRMAPVLKKLFPRLGICITGDALYANQAVMAICEGCGWSYALRFKPGSLPKLYRTASELVAANPANRATKIRGKGKRMYRQAVQWHESLRYEGHLCHALFFQESCKNKTYDAAWLLSSDLRPSLVDPFLIAANARLRWKIENEAFNTCKNGACHLKHQFGLTGNSWKNYFHLAQIAQLFHDLIRLSDVVGKLMAGSGSAARKTFARAFGSVTRFARRLVRCMCVSSDQALDEVRRSMDDMQVRFSTA
jgi:hypothetical protein